MIKPKPYKLINTIQHYDWGARGSKAYIPKLLDVTPKTNKHYAELWMGAHPKAPSKIIFRGEAIDLSEAINLYPKQILGLKVAKNFNKTLPFLFKVLSAGEALSIQVHPNKRQAQWLHQKDPVNYPDTNQKHEIAIVLDPVIALIGFKSFDNVVSTLNEYPDIKQFIGKISWFNDARRKSIKGIVTGLIKKSVSDVEGLNSTINLLNKKISKKKNKTEIEKYFVKLYKKYKSDVGLLLTFFLNLVHLKKGEAVFTKPGIPHVYLKGNLLECMSNSDNVIRGGLTPKYKDIESLLKILTYDSTSPRILKGKQKRHSKLYQTNAQEFKIELFEVSDSELVFINQSGPRIILILDNEIKFSYELEGRQKVSLYSKGNSILLPSILSEYKIILGKRSKFVQVSVPA